MQARGPEAGCSGGATGSDASSSSSNDEDSNPSSPGCSSNSIVHGDRPSQLQRPSADQWQKRQRRKHTRLFAVQREILERLGIRRPPNVTASNLTAQDMERFHEMLRQSESQDRTIYQREFYAKRFQTVLPSCGHPRNSDTLWDDISPTEMRFYFPFEQTVATNRHRETRVLVANLRLRRKQTTANKRSAFRKSSNVSEDSIVQIKVSMYTKPIRRGRKASSAQKKVVSTLLVNRNSGLTWARIDIRTAVEDWIRRANRNHGLQITVESDRRLVDPYEIFERFDCNSRIIASLPVLTFSNPELESASDAEDDPVDVENSRSLPDTFLDVVTVDVPRRRPARSYRDLHSIYHQRSSCGMEKMFISFSELGWSDWIIQPKGFETGFCRGSCVKRTGSKTGNRQISADITSVGLNECCGPVRAKSLSVLQFDNRGKLSIAVFDDLIVTSCGCRR